MRLAFPMLNGSCYSQIRLLRFSKLNISVDQALYQYRLAVLSKSLIFATHCNPLFLFIEGTLVKMLNTKQIKPPTYISVFRSSKCSNLFWAECKHKEQAGNICCPCRGFWWGFQVLNCWRYWWTRWTSGSKILLKQLVCSKNKFWYQVMLIEHSV